jgi:hypothetical protein
VNDVFLKVSRFERYAKPYINPETGAPLSPREAEDLLQDYQRRGDRHRGMADKGQGVAGGRHHGTWADAYERYADALFAALHPIVFRDGSKSSTLLTVSCRSLGCSNELDPKDARAHSGFCGVCEALALQLITRAEVNIYRGTRNGNSTDNWRSR